MNRLLVHNLILHIIYAILITKYNTLITDLFKYLKTSKDNNYKNLHTKYKVVRGAYIPKSDA